MGRGTSRQTARARRTLSLSVWRRIVGHPHRHGSASRAPGRCEHWGVCVGRGVGSTVVGKHGRVPSQGARWRLLRLPAVLRRVLRSARVNRVRSVRREPAVDDWCARRHKGPGEPASNDAPLILGHVTRGEGRRTLPPSASKGGSRGGVCACVCGMAPGAAVRQTPQRAGASADKGKCAPCRTHARRLGAYVEHTTALLAARPRGAALAAISPPRCRVGPAALWMGGGHTLVGCSGACACA